MKRGLDRKYTLWIASLVGSALALQGLISAGLTYRDSVRLVEQRQAAEARYGAERINGFLRGIERAVDWAARLAIDDSLLAADRARIRTELHAALRAEPALTSLALHAFNGDCLRVLRADADDSRCRSDPAERPSTPGRFAYSPVEFADGGTPIVAIRHAVHSTAPMLVATVNVSAAWSILEDLDLVGGAEVFLTDASGRLLAHRDRALVLRAEQPSAAADPNASRSELATLSAMSPTIPAGRVIRQVAAVSSNEWRVVVEAPIAVALGPVYDSLLRAALITAIGVTVALGLSRLFALRLSAPIAALAAGARDFGAGQLDRRINVQGTLEVERLAGSFNAMADQIQDYTQSLERKVADKTRELAQANEHKSQFLALVSHELRTPLNGVIGFSEALQAELFGPLNDKQREYVGDIHVSGLQLLALINDLLDMSKIEAGRMELELAPFDLAQLVLGACGSLRLQAERGAVALSNEVETCAQACVGDERRLRQVLLNLVSNAVKFTRPGGSVLVRAVQTPYMLTLTVADTGIGIAPADRGRLFEPFSQLRSAAQARQEGTGLGLALTRRLVELHGGTIEVDSLPGAGSTFTVRIPLVAA
jgi:signal transduction histidine kinase